MCGIWRSVTSATVPNSHTLRRPLNNTTTNSFFVHKKWETYAEMFSLLTSPHMLDANCCPSRRRKALAQSAEHSASDSSNVWPPIVSASVGTSRVRSDARLAMDTMTFRVAASPSSNFHLADCREGWSILRFLNVWSPCAPSLLSTSLKLR